MQVTCCPVTPTLRVVQNKQLLLMAANNLNMSVSGGQGVAYLSTVVKAPSGTANAGQLVVAQRFVIGNESLASSRVGTPSSAIWPDPANSQSNGGRRGLRRRSFSSGCFTQSSWILARGRDCLCSGSFLRSQRHEFPFGVGTSAITVGFDHLLLVRSNEHDNQTAYAHPGAGRSAVRLVDPCSVWFFWAWPWTYCGPTARRLFLYERWMRPRSRRCEPFTAGPMRWMQRYSGRWKPTSRRGPCSRNPFPHTTLIEDLQGSQRITVTARATSPTFFLRWFGHDHFDISATATSFRRDVNLVLVLGLLGFAQR